jgi:hypothetical protein
MAVATAAKAVAFRRGGISGHGNGDTLCTLALAAPHRTVQASLTSIALPKTMMVATMPMALSGCAGGGRVLNRRAMRRWGVLLVVRALHAAFSEERSRVSSHPNVSTFHLLLPHTGVWVDLRLYKSINERATMTPACKFKISG